MTHGLPSGSGLSVRGADQLHDPRLSRTFHTAASKDAGETCETVLTHLSGIRAPEAPGPQTFHKLRDATRFSVGGWGRVCALEVTFGAPLAISGVGVASLGAPCLSAQPQGD